VNSGSEQSHPTVSAIDTAAGYREAIDRIASGSGPIAVDAERASGFRYSQRAYLVQMFRRGSGVFLFDPPAIGGFQELNAAIAAEEWVLHAASQDLPCLREVGLDPQRIFDTELASRLLGLQKVGLGSVVEQLLGIHLAKEHSAADWSRRPLPQSWLVYAALDVELLIDLRDAMDALLAEAGKLSIARQEFEAVLRAIPRAPGREPWRRLSGLHAIKDVRILAVARELWQARDELAQASDTAPGRLVPDAALVAAARAKPASKRELAALREFTGRASRSELDRWWAAIERGRSTEELPALRGPGERIPPARSWSTRNPEADRRLRAAREALGEASEELELPLENLLKPSLLRRLAWEPPEPLSSEGVASALAELGARPWQIEVSAQRIAEAFVGADQIPEEPGETAS